MKLTTMIKPRVMTGDVDRVYPIYLNLEPNKVNGAVLIIPETIDEKLYTTLVKYGSLTTESQFGKVELGHTSTDGVSIKAVVSKVNLISDALEYMLALAKSIVQKGIQEDKGFTNIPRYDLDYSLKNIGIYIDDELLHDAPRLTRFPHSPFSTVMQDPRYLKMYQSAKLVPDGYEAEIN